MLLLSAYLLPDQKFSKRSCLRHNKKEIIGIFSRKDTAISIQCVHDNSNMGTFDYIGLLELNTGTDLSFENCCCAVLPDTILLLACFCTMKY